MDGRAIGPDRDPRFPGGPWTGFYLRYWLPGRHATDLTLTWADGVMEGSGRDAPGAFTVSGTYDPATGRCEWTKQYVGKHAVAYRGVADGSGVWGVWEIRLFGGLYFDRGGFHIWQEGMGTPADAGQTERAVLALMREEFGSPLARAGRAVLTLGVAAALAALAWWATGY
jgi:hypothetical protein